MNKKRCDRCNRLFSEDIINNNKGYCDICSDIVNKSNETDIDYHKYEEDLYGKHSSRVHTDDT